MEFFGRFLNFCFFLVIKTSLGSFLLRKQFVNNFSRQPQGNDRAQILSVAANESKFAIAKNGSAAIRLPNDDFCKKIIDELGKPIISTSANISGSQNPKAFDEIDTKLKDNVDYVVNLRQAEIMEKPSSIIKIFDDGKIEKIR